jgi:uncharacterized protein YecE (DUF72 family)
MIAQVHIGTAGWSIPRLAVDSFRDGGSVLERYATRFSAVEINSSFHRPHRRATYERWAAATPDGFRFAVKVPRQVTHDQRLASPGELLFSFREQIQGLGDKLGPLLIQLPPSLAFDADIAASFFAVWRDLFDGPTVCEPRHPSWLSAEADGRLIEAGVARAAADPATDDRAAAPGGFGGLAYFRLHGSPVMYASAYGDERLAALAQAVMDKAQSRPTWCVFDNTKFGAATTDALALMGRMEEARGRPRRSRSALG